MKAYALVLALLGLASLVTAFPQDAEASGAVEPELNKREKAFQALLDHSILEGRFTVHGRPDQEAMQPERYTIGRVSKVKGEKWRVEARMEFMGKDVTFPVPVNVRFVDDETPVIVVDGLGLPGVGRYGARVIFAHEEYAGIWWGKDYGGQLFGKVLRGAAKAAGGGDRELASGPEGAWPQFRGAYARGVADGHPLPESFDVESGENIRYRKAIAGLSHSAPVIWGDRLFLTNSIPVDGEEPFLKVGRYGSVTPVEDEPAQRFVLACYDKRDGSELWERVAFEGVPAIKRHPKGSHAASTPATDGKRVVAFYGSEGMFCYSMDGELLWEKSFGVLDSGYWKMRESAQWGFAASPVLHDDKVLLVCDVQENSFLIALDAASGDEIWRTEREEKPGWGSPTVDVRDGRSQVVLNGWQLIGGYDLETGAALWSMKGRCDIPIPTPVIAFDTIFLTNAHGAPAPIYAIDPMVSGTIDLSDESPAGMRWWKKNGGSYMPTPLVYGDHLYLSGDAGVLTCLVATTGDEVYRERLDTGGFTASPVAGDGKIYVPSEIGEVHVVETGPAFSRLSVSTLDEECMASPAISEGTLYFRTRRHLVAVSLPPQ